MQTPLVYRCSTPTGPRRFPAIITTDAHGLKCVKVGYVRDKGIECHYPGGVYQLRYRQNGKQKFVSLDKCDNHPHVLLIHADMARKGILRATQTAGKRVSVSLEQKSRDYLIDLRKNGHNAAARQAEYVFEEFLPLVVFSAVTRQDVLNYQAWLRSEFTHRGRTREKRAHDRTIFNRHRILTSFLKWAKITVDDMPKPPKRPKKTPQVCTDEQLETLLTYLRKHDMFLLVAVEMGRQLGLRKRELMFAAWSDVQWAEGIFLVTEKPEMKYTTKTRQERVLPMSDSLLVLLREWRAQRPDTKLILETRTGKPHHSLLNRLKDRVKEAGLPAKDFSLHMLRRKFLTVALRKGVDVATVKDLAGHSSIAVTALYLEAQKAESLRGDMNRIFGDK